MKFVDFSKIIHMATGGGGGAQKGLEGKVYKRKSFKGPKTNSYEEAPRSMASQEFKLRTGPPFARLDAATHDSSSDNRVHDTNPIEGEGLSGNDMVGLGFLNRVPVKLAFSSKKDKRDLRRKLERELNVVRNLMRKIERNKNPKLSGNEGFSGAKLKRAHSEVGSVGLPEGRHRDIFSTPVRENSQGGSDNVEKEKRTPKANQFYQSDNFILGKEKVPPSDHNKKSKYKGKKIGTDFTFGFGTGNSSSRAFKSCSLLLDRLMKHKHGWVFNTPVDVKGMSLHDYFTIIKHPMDLGTVKSRLNSNWYKSPKEFAEDVRLTFQNAMTYNPKGHDVHVMAEQLLNVFEDKWAVIEGEYLEELRISAESESVLPTPNTRIAEASFSSPTTREASLPTPTSGTAPPPPPPPPPPAVNMASTSDISESMTNSVVPKPQNVNVVPGRTPVPKKPKAKDPHKRDMTYDEKQKLSTSLQNLPSEKLDHVVRIIKKRNPSLCQNDDEIEVDIDSVDIETLWELDRFIMYYRKSLSKNKKKAELAQARLGAEPEVQGKSEPPLIAEEAKEDQSAEDENAFSSLPVQGEPQVNNESESNSSSNSSSDSGSSSSDADTDTSSV